MSGGKAETLLGLSDLEICHSHQATGTDHSDTSKSTQAGKGAELGFTPKADGDSPELRFPSQRKFPALLRVFRPVPSLREPWGFEDLVRASVSALQGTQQSSVAPREVGGP